VEHMAYLDRDGVSIYYEVHGPRDPGDPSRPTLLLSHGYSATADMWVPNLEALTADRYVVTWDIRGHGRSASPEDQSLYTEALSVDDMAAILDECGAGQAVIGGLSLGGYLSLAFNLAYPERVRALILCDTGPGFRKDEPRQAWNDQANAWADGYERDGLRALGSGAETKVAVHTSAAGLAKAARGILTQHDSRVIDSLSSITVPTLVVVGSEDKPFLAAADMMAAKIPGATKAVIPGAGHAANIDQTFNFDRALVAFLDTV
jgi:pimeloyl-ACP methyl ester carboxylesterase